MRSASCFFPVLLLAALALLAGCVSVPAFDAPRRLEAEGRLVEALRVYEQMASVATGANRASVEVEIRRVRRALTDGALGQAASALGTGRPTLPAVEAALRKLDESSGYDDERGRLAVERARLRALQAELRSDYEKALRQAERAAAAEDWSAALAALGSAEAISGGSPELRQRARGWGGKRDAGLARLVREAVGARDLALAGRRLDELATAKPAAEDGLIEALRVEVENLRRALFIEAQQALVGQRRYFTAYRNLLAEDFPAARELLATVRVEGAAHYLGVARRERDANEARLGFAYLAAVKAKEMDGERDEIFTLHRDLDDALDAFITLRVAVAGFESPASAPGLGSQVSDALITYLIDHLPYGVRVIERAQTDQAMAGRAGDITKIGRQLDAEIVVVGNVSSLNLERKRSEREVTEIVQVGTQKEPNPLYAQMAAKHGANTAAWPFAVPPLIDGAPIMETVRFKQGEEVLNGVMVAYVRSFEAARGTVTQSREFSTTENFKDGFRDAVPLARITYDPLELPTDNEVRERLRARLVAQIADEVLKRYADREQRYLRDAETALQRRETDLAALNLAAAHHYSTVAAAAIAGGRANPAVVRIDRLGLFELTE